MKKVRFWEWVNGSPVKITLYLHKPLDWGQAWGHEEGWSSKSCRWELTTDSIVRTSGTDGRDCDGRLSTTTVCTAKTTELAVVLPHYAPDRELHPGMMFPDWDKIDSRQYDEYAEMMNY